MGSNCLFVHGRTFIPILSLVLLPCSNAFGQDNKDFTDLRDRPTARIVATSPKLSASVEIKTDIIGRDDPRAPMCAGTTHPCRGVQRLAIKANGNALFVPTSVFFDLADLRKGQITFAGGQATLRLVGGDASETYNVQIVFDASRVIRRSLSSGLTDDEPLQETDYHDVVLE